MDESRRIGEQHDELNPRELPAMRVVYRFLPLAMSVLCGALAVVRPSAAQAQSADVIYSRQGTFRIPFTDLTHRTPAPRTMLVRSQ